MLLGPVGRSRDAADTLHGTGQHMTDNGPAQGVGGAELRLGNPSPDDCFAVK